MEMLAVQRSLNRLRNDHKIPDVMIFNEHDEVYTVGIHRNPQELLDPSVQPVQIERGGSVTFHGPGQIVSYLVLNLMERRTNIRAVIQAVQRSVSTTLQEYGINSEGRLDKETGVWTSSRKICSIGFAIRESSTLHGIALNVNTDLSSFSKIMPCGFQSAVMTSMENELGSLVDFNKVLGSLKKNMVQELDLEPIKKIENFGSLKRLIQ